MNSNLPYFSLFSSFRNSGYPLGIGDYQDFLEILSYPAIYNQQKPLLEKRELLALCKLLWLKPNQVPYLFEDIFEECYLKFFTVAKERPDFSNFHSDISNKQEEKEVYANREDNEKLPVPEKPRADSSLHNNVLKESYAQTPSPMPADFAAYFTIEAGQKKEAGLYYHKEKSQTENQRFIFSDEYIPVEKRELYQCIRLLPEKRSTKIPDEIDIHESLLSIAKFGFFAGFETSQKKQITSDLIILHDTRGSMIAFEKISKLLAEVTKDIYKEASGVNKRVFNYYFQNVITKYVFEDQANTKYKKITDVVNIFKDKRVAIIILSDAGAARRSRSMARVMSTVRMLFVLKKIASKIVWLNPFPQQRWEGTSAKEIANYIPMFHFGTPGLQRSIDTLRGRRYKRSMK